MTLLVSVVMASPAPFYGILYLLILTGQRRNEIAAAEWSWIDGDTMTIPAHVAKNGIAHTFPLGAMAQTYIATLPKTSTYLFPAGRSHVRNKPTTHFNSWSKSKAALDKILPLAPWTLHDLRRTYSTAHAKLGTPIHVTERLLNHVSGTISGVAAIYNQHTYFPEMKKAVDTYQAYIQSLTCRGTF